MASSENESKSNRSTGRPAPRKESLQSLADSLSYKEQLDLERELSRRSPAHFAVIASNGKWMPAPHLMLLNSLLVMVELRVIKRLLITLAPRMGKSELISKYLPPYWLGKHPDERLILASYEHEFASEWGRKARDILEANGERLFGLKIRQDSKAADRWEIDKHGGGMQTCGVGGALTGKGANCVVAGTMVSTEIGQVDIADLVVMRNLPRVLAFDHKRNRLVWCKVVATRESESKDIYEITTTGGHQVRATGDHRFFVAGAGYREAKLLKAGDRLAQEIAAEHSLRGMQATQDCARDDLQPLLCGIPSDSCCPSVCMVQQGIRESSRRVSQGIQED